MSVIVIIAWIKTESLRENGNWFAFYSDFKSGVNRSRFQARDLRKFPFLSMDLFPHGQKVCLVIADALRPDRKGLPVASSSTLEKHYMPVVSKMANTDNNFIPTDEAVSC